MSEQKFLTMKKVMVDLTGFDETRAGCYEGAINGKSVVVEQSGDQRRFRIGPLYVAIGKKMEPGSLYWTISIDGKKVGTRQDREEAIKFARAEAAR